jgi:hypothetical protein
MKVFCSQINLHQATMTAITVMPGSITAYTISPWNNTQVCRTRKDERNSLADGASCSNSNPTSTPKQRNGGKHDPATPDTNEDNSSGHQKQKKPRRGVKVDTAAKEKKNWECSTSGMHASTPWIFSPSTCLKSFALILLAREKSVTTLIVTLLTPGILPSSNARQSSILPVIFKKRRGLVQRISFHENT